MTAQPRTISRDFFTVSHVSQAIIMARIMYVDGGGSDAGRLLPIYVKADDS